MYVNVDPHRLQGEVDDLLQYPVETGKVLLYGSSFFAVWEHERAKQQLAEIGVVNHGFGAATGEELLYHYAYLVKPYAPRAILLRGGINDISWGYSPERAVEFLVRICEWAAREFPGVRFGLLPSFECPWMRRETNRYKLLCFNRLLKEYADTAPNTVWLDLTPFFAEGDGFRDVFQPDGLHLTDAGYEQFAPWFVKLLRDGGFGE